ncbi:MAG: substrate-binding domain-containing protein, partial [Planctomycetaceae bacterium]
GFLDVVADRKKYPKIKILSDSEHIDSSVQKAKQVSESLLGKFGKEIKGVFTVCEPNNKGMYLALQQYVHNKDNNAKPGDIKFVGFDSDPRMIEGLQNGMVQGLVLQNPVNMGYVAVKTMVAHLDGKTVEKRIPTGEEIALPEHLKKDHKDYAKFQELLKPKRL